MSRIVDVDEVLGLFGIEDEDFYAKGTIEDALYDGSLKVIEPRKTGKWIKADKGHVEYTAVCSACGDEWAWSYVKLFNHCPNCGIQMRASRKMMDVDSVIKKQKTGKWVKVSGYATLGGDPVWCCSECGKGLHVYGIEHGTYGEDVSDGQWVACPNCGAVMEENNERN